MGIGKTRVHAAHAPIRKEFLIGQRYMKAPTNSTEPNKCYPKLLDERQEKIRSMKRNASDVLINGFISISA